MSANLFYPGQRAEKRHLLTGGLGMPAMAGLIWFITGWWVFPTILACMGGVQLIAWMAYPLIGRSVFLVFSLIAFWISQLISWLMVYLMYLFGVMLIGFFLRLCGMNRLERNFGAARRKDSMFHEAPASDLDSFGRQS
ncbi:MAG: hypothetical protein P9L94_18975 [Candidatus Hinthialibacter antarcticus]|nr:hypothetical protein [Candidatus Hinthialibacter antarcticus]